MFVLLACAVSAMLCEVVVSSSVRRGHAHQEEAKVEMEFDVVLCQSELTDRALQLLLLLPPGFQPVSLHSYHTRTQTHTHTRNPVCLIQWMLNGAEQPSIVLWSPYLSHRAFKLCVCTWCGCVCV